MPARPRTLPKQSTSPRANVDYDPTEEALDIGHKLGVEQERKHQQPRIAQAARGGKRRGHAAATREYKQARQRTAGARANTKRITRDYKLQKLEASEAQARRAGYAAGRADTRRENEAARRAQRDAQNQAITTTGTTTGIYARAPRSAPSFGSSRSTGYFGSIERSTAIRGVVLLTAVSAIAVVIRDAQKGGVGKLTVPITVPSADGKTSTTETIKVPGHLYDLGGVLVGGVVCVIIAEFAPVLGLAMSAALVINAIGNPKSGPLGMLGNAFTSRPAQSAQPGQRPIDQVNNLPSGSHWVHTPYGDTLEPNTVPGTQKA